MRTDVMVLILDNELVFPYIKDPIVVHKHRNELNIVGLSRSFSIPQLLDIEDGVLFEIFRGNVPSYCRSLSHHFDAVRNNIRRHGGLVGDFAR